MRRLMIFTAAALVFGALGFFSRPAPAEDYVKLGAYLPMAGGVAAYGQMEWRGIETARLMESEVLGKKIEVVREDTKSDPIESSNAVSLLVEMKVAGIIGEAISADTMAGNPISEKAQIPSVSPTATNPLVTQGKKYAFRACFIDPFQGEVAARFALNNLKAKTAALIIDHSQDYSVGLGSFFEKEFEKLGGKVVSKTFIQTGDQDFSAQLSSIQASQPELIYAPIYYTEDALMAKQARDLGIKTPIMTGDGAQADQLIEIGGKAVEGMYLTGHFHKDAVTTRRAKEFMKRYEGQYREDVNAFVALGADAYFLLVEAIKRAGSTEGPRVRDALADTRDFMGVSGTLTMGPDGNPIKSVVINKVENGKFVYVATVNP
ncbi:MAG TPA: ABC transporter substrate-binding protein [Syntrophobacteraceae bacterium]|nr:ABC transporter substrate-binding protein [Syntrophobacteraceae bacterium]